MDVKFYLCRKCGNLICKVVDSGVTPVCCGEEMKLLEARSADLGVEKHLPVVERVDENTILVKVGSVQHPTTPEHHIVMIALQTVDGVSVKPLAFENGEAPEAKFSCKVGEAVGVYEFCSLHGLWFTPVSE